jgi:hypothetical protein
MKAAAASSGSGLVLAQGWAGRRNAGITMWAWTSRTLGSGCGHSAIA